MRLSDCLRFESSDVMSFRRLFVHRGTLLQSNRRPQSLSSYLLTQGNGQMTMSHNSPVNTEGTKPDKRDNGKGELQSLDSTHEKGSQHVSELRYNRIGTHQFDTYKLVSALQLAGFTRRQAIALMKCLRTVLVNGTEIAKSHYLSRGDHENVRLFRYLWWLI